MNHGKYKIEWTLIAVAIFVTVISVIADYYSIDCNWFIRSGAIAVIADCCSTDCNWFARSGAITVLLAAIVEYRISSHVFDDIYRAMAQQQHSGFATKPKTPKNRSILSFFTHTVLIIGTIIWGYGDLLWS
jgi:hypothetical protein